ncbi:hypothetical protein DPMN_113164, partial [Dreissena polymorpha]
MLPGTGIISGCLVVAVGCEIMSSALEKNGLKCLNAVLPDDFEAKLVSDQGRIYYL